MKRIGLTGIAVMLLAMVGAAFFLLLGGETLAPQKIEGPLRVGIECDFMPYNWQEDKASATNMPLLNNEGFYAEGYDVQIVRILAESLDVEVEFFKFPWGELLEALNGGKIDMVASGMADTAARKELADFSTLYNPYPAAYTVVVRSDSRYAEATTLADFYKARMVGQKGTMMDSLIDQIYGVNHLPPVDNPEQMFLMVTRGLADGLVMNLESIEPYKKKYWGLTEIAFVRGEGFDPGFTGVCVAVRKGDANLLRALNSVLSKLSTATRVGIMQQMTELTEKSS